MECLGWFFGFVEVFVEDFDCVWCFCVLMCCFGVDFVL